MPRSHVISIELKALLQKAQVCLLQSVGKEVGALGVEGWDGCLLSWMDLRQECKGWLAFLFLCGSDLFVQCVSNLLPMPLPSDYEVHAGQGLCLFPHSSMSAPSKGP